MTEEVFIDIFIQGINVFLISITPILIVSLAIGLLISIFQTVTQINEQTLTFAPKIIITFISLGLLFGWIIQNIAEYTLIIFTKYLGMI